MTRPTSHASKAAAGPAAMTYQLPSAGTTVWLGLGTAQLGALAVTLLLTVALMLSDAPLPLTLFVAAAGGMAGAWPVAGRTCVQWLPLLTAHGLLKLFRGHLWRLPLGDLATTATATSDQAEPANHGPNNDLPLPTPLPGDLRVAGARVPLTSSPAGTVVLLDRNRHSGTVVLGTTATGRFGVLDPPGQDLTLQLWGGSLAALLHLPGVTQVQWTTHAGPHLHVPPAVSSPSNDSELATDPLRRDQAELLSAASSLARRHRTTLCITLELDSSGQRARAARDAALTLVDRTVQDAAAALLACDILSYPLPLSELTDTLHQLLDPDQPHHAAADPARPAQTSRPLAVSARVAWTHCVTDDVAHRTFAVTGWPRNSLRADWLAGLLHHPLLPGTARTLTVQARPVSQAQAARRARASAAKARLDAADRQRLGFTSSAATALDESDAEQTESELVAGYRMADLTALLTLHAGSLRDLDVASGQLRTSALTHRIDLRPVHGQHQQALAAALPLGFRHGSRA
jgi:hypothetical protein